MEKINHQHTFRLDQTIVDGMAMISPKLPRTAINASIILVSVALYIHRTNEAEVTKSRPS